MSSNLILLSLSVVKMIMNEIATLFRCFLTYYLSSYSHYQMTIEFTNNVYGHNMSWCVYHTLYNEQGVYMHCSNYS